jgi:hypothetical protein
MEAIKGFIFGRGKTELVGVPCHSYLVSFVLITDEPLDLVAPTGETIVMGGSPINSLTPTLQTLTKYEPPHCLGDASNAILSVSNMNPQDLEKVTKKKKAKK